MPASAIGGSRPKRGTVAPSGNAGSMVGSQSKSSRSTLCWYWSMRKSLKPVNVNNNYGHIPPKLKPEEGVEASTLEDSSLSCFVQLPSHNEPSPNLTR